MFPQTNCLVLRKPSSPQPRKGGILHRKLGISLKTYYNWISGIRPMPHTKLKEMSKMFGTKIDYLVEETEPLQEQLE